MSLDTGDITGPGFGGVGAGGGTGGGTGGGVGVGAGGLGGIGANMEPIIEIISPSSGELRTVFDFDKLKGQSNYIYWSDKVKLGLTYLGLWEYINGEIAKPSMLHPTSRTNWIRNDQRALLLMNSRIESSLHSRVRLCSTSSDLWEKLESLFKLKGSQGQAEALMKWERLSLKEGGNISQYIAENDELISEVSELGLTFSDSYAALRLLMGLPTSWAVFSQTIQVATGERGETLDYDKVSRLIIQEDNRRYLARTRVHGDRVHQSEETEGVMMAGNRDNNNPHKDIKCHECGYKGHLKRNCFRLIGFPKGHPKHPDTEQKQSTSRDDSKQKENWSNNETKASAASVEVDFTGAFMAGRQRRSDGYAKAVGVGRSQASTRRNQQPTDQTQPRRPNLHMADMDFALQVKDVNLAGKVTEKDAPFLLDSGCSYHFCGNKDWFSELNECDGPTVEIADKTAIKVGQGGTICFSSDLGGGKRSTFSLSNVYYIPGFCNLISLGQLHEKDVSVEFTKGGFTMITAGQIIAKGSNYPKNLFKLDVDVIQGGIKAAASVGTKAEEAMVWHRRLGHPSVTYMNSLVEAGTIPGLTKDHVESALQQGCLTCTKGKASSKPFPDSTNRASAPLELVHSDLAGPMPIKTRGGCRYWITFLDDYSRYLWTYGLHSKKDAVIITKDWLSMVENQLKVKLGTLRTDNGGEYSKLDEFLTERGVRRETTIPHTPQQNGRAERVNRTLSERIACMLMDSGLSAPWWGEALLYSTYVINRLPSKPISMQSPYEVMFGIIPDLSDLHVFGSPCQALRLPRPKKLQEKTVSCIFLGYADLKKGYRLWNKEKQTIIYSRDVTFFEDPDKHLELRMPMNEVNMESSPFSSPEEETEQVDQIEPDEGSGHEEGDIQSESELGGFGDEDSEGGEAPAAGIEGAAPGNEDRAPNLENRIEPERIEQPQPQPRYPARNRRQPGQWWIANPDERANAVEESNSYEYFVANAVSEREAPRSYEEAMQSGEREQWSKAMDKELASMDEHEVFDITPLPPGYRAVGSRWVFAYKMDALGSITSYKARLVAQGFNQRAGIDYDETYAPVARMNSTRLFLAYITAKKFHVIQADVKTAYLNGQMEQEVYMRIPKGVENPKGMVYRVKKSLYGLKQSARAWNTRIDSQLKEMGFNPLGCEPCVYTRKSDGAIIILYVDDLGIAAASQEATDEIYQKLTGEFKCEKIGNMEDGQWLGVRIRRNREAQTVALTQERYIIESLKVFGLLDAVGAKSPLPADLDDSPLRDDEVITDMPYLKGIGTLMYIAQSSRPDIAFATGFLARFCALPGDRHFDYVMHVFRYLKHTKDYGLWMEHRATPVLEVFSDADWAGDHHTRRSTNGGLIKAWGSTVVYSSRKQKSVARSTLEAEYIAASNTAQNLQWVLLFMQGLDVEIKEPVPFYIDNTSAISTIVNGSITERSKHIDIAYKIARELHTEGTINVMHLRSEQMPADLLTKPLTRQRTMDLMDKLGVCRIGSDGRKWVEPEVGDGKMCKVKGTGGAFEK